MSKSNRREQASKRERVQNEAMGEAFRELRKGSRAQPHRNMTKYNRSDWRKEVQRGMY